MIRIGEQWRQWLAAGALCVITFLAYANSFQSGFVLDNRFHLLQDTRVHQATAENLALILNHSYWWPYADTGLYRPVTNLSFLFNYAILGNGENPAGYHWINFLLHAGNVLLVFALARRLLMIQREGRPGGRPQTGGSAPHTGGSASHKQCFWPSFLVAAVWAVHPVLTESVTNMVGRSDLLAGMTTLGGLLIYFRSTETSGARRLAWLAGLLAVTAVGVFSKESAVAVLGVIAVYEITWWDRKRLRGFLLACLAMAPALLAMLWVRTRVLAAEPPARFPYLDNPIAAADFWIGRLTALKVMALYLARLVWPVTLSPDYSYAQIPLVDGRLSDWVAWFVVLAAAVAIALLYRRNKTAFFAAGLALATILPASNLLIPTGTIMAERLLYLPAVGFALCLILALDFLARRFRMAALTPVAMGFLIVAGFGARTYARNADWRDDIAFWSAAVRTSPLSFKTHGSLAESLQTDHLDPDRVLEEGERSVALLDSVPDRLNSVAPYSVAAAQHIAIGDSFLQHDASGRVLMPPESLQKYEKARSFLLRAVSILQASTRVAGTQPLGRGDPRLTGANIDIDPYLMLSEVEQRLGKTGEAVNRAREARLISPLRPPVYLRIHNSLLAAGRSRGEAVAALLEGVLLTSDASLTSKAVQDYADDPAAAKCAISYAEAAPQIDFSCPIVRRQVCSISDDALRLASIGRRQDLAARLRKEFTAKYGCPETPAGPLP